MRGRGSGGPALLRLRVPLLLVISSAPVAPGDERPAAPPEEGIALAIVYDTSGSMTDPVPDGGGGRAPKYVIANRALDQIVDRLQAYVASAPPHAPRRIEAGPFRLKDTASRSGKTLSAHFVAFDIDADRFNALRALGATVVGAADARQLDQQFEYILERKILLEDEEPPAKGRKAD